jgi:ankyrin repeat protein
MSSLPLPTYRYVEQGDIDAVKARLDGEAVAPGASLSKGKESVEGEGLPEGVTLLSIAVAHDHKEMAKFLIGREAKVNVTTASGWTPLHSAAFKGYREMAELLVEHGANVSAEIPGEDGSKPSELALENGHKGLAQWLKTQPAVRSPADNDEIKFLEKLGKLKDPRPDKGPGR